MPSGKRDASSTRLEVRLRLCFFLRRPGPVPKRMSFWLGLLVGVSPLLAATPAEKDLLQARAQVTREGTCAAYSALANASTRRGMETADAAFFREADQALRQCLTLHAGSIEAAKSRVFLLLAEQEYAAAAAAASRLNRRVPDDLAVYGYLADAEAGLGDYAGAVAATQWILKLRAGNPAGLERAGYLREVTGDLDGAMEATGMAYDATPAAQVEDRARLLIRMAHLRLAAGDPAEAEQFAGSALQWAPGASAALGVLGEIRMAQKRYPEAAALFRRQHETTPAPRSQFALAQALAAAGLAAEAGEAFAAFERDAAAVCARADNANPQLVSYYLANGRPAEALAAARLEIARRHDIYTLDAYACALAGAGDLASARVEMAKALAVGTSDQEILRHARALGLRPAAPGGGE